MYHKYNYHFLFLSLFFFLFTNLFSWTDHSLGTYASLENMPEIKNAKKVPVESIESFLEKEKVGLQKLIDEQEIYSRQNIQNYPPKPSALNFNISDKKELRKNFLIALRLNQNIKLGYYIQELPGVNIPSNKKMNVKDIVFYKDTEFTSRLNFYSIKEKELVAPINILATASDEPDYGNDIGLFSDSNTEQGKIYEFGPIPFGNPKYEYSTQAPFHMGFFHEAGIIYAAAPVLKRTNPEIRLYQNLTLAEYAFQTGHPYWGYRFLGWGLHYIQDLTQPYHSTVLPGASAAKMLGINFLAILSFDGLKNSAIEKVSDRHTSIEHYQYEFMEYLYRKKMNNHKMILSYSELDEDKKYGNYDINYPRKVLTYESNSRASELDEKITDWKEILHFTKKESRYEDITDLEKSKEVDEYLNQLVKSFGAHSRNYIRAVIK